jgi:integrase
VLDADRRIRERQAVTPQPSVAAGQRAAAAVAPVVILSQSHIDTYAAARKSGVLGDKRPDETVRGVRDGTVRSDIVWLAALFNFARGHRVGGRPLLRHRPLADLVLPKERNVRRPVASDERYRLTLAKADQADATGRLACLLALSRFTGRRINAICHLRASDVLLSPDALTRELALGGLDPSLARHMPHGAIRWRAENDKQGYEDIAPISAQARAALDRYLRSHPTLGDAWMFPQQKPPHRPMTIADARILRIRAEALAELPVIDCGGFHAYRRLWVVERKHLPDVDVARGGGWRDLRALKTSYQSPDPATTLRVIENEAPPADTVKRSGEGSA